MELDGNSTQSVGTPPIEVPAQRFTPVAPWLNTVVLLVILFGVSYLGAVTQHGGAAKRGHLPTYLLTIAYEWVLVGVIVLGIRRRGVRLRDLIGGRWSAGDPGKSAIHVLRDIGIAAVFLLGARILLGVVALAVGLAKASAVAETRSRLVPLAPVNGKELIVFFIVSLTAGFCEEILCRGYLQRQFTALTKNEAMGVVLQGVVFGIGHGYQGPRLMIVLTVFGILFGALVVLTKNLRPAMIAHALNDAGSGVALYYLAR